MKKWKKVTLGIGIAVALLIIVVVSIRQASKGVVTVQTTKVVKHDITSLVTASGEVRPKNYTNVLGEGFGKITDIVVKEGDYVRRGDILLHLESIQPAADVQAQQASMDSAQAMVQSAEANYKAAVATLAQRQADFQKAKFDWERSQQLYQGQLISKQDYDAQKAAYESASAAVQASAAQVQQAKAAREQAHFNLQQAQAMLVHSRDVLRKTTYRAPIDGIVTNIAVRVGENVVPGIQNSPGSFLLTISDMSVVNADVMVDETDIPSVKNGQLADISVDAYPGQTFTGRVNEVGDQAILRTSGLATTQQTYANTQEARDFEVLITLANPPKGIRPGLSCTAKVRTAERHDVLTIPIQALAMRSRKELQESQAKANGKERGVTLAAAKPDDALDASKQDVQGVFVVRNGKAVFVPIQTGIMGVTDIEVTGGLKQGDEIVTGSYKALRTLRSGARVKIDNSPPKPPESTS